MALKKITTYRFDDTATCYQDTCDCCGSDIDGFTLDFGKRTVYDRDTSIEYSFEVNICYNCAKNFRDKLNKTFGY